MSDSADEKRKIIIDEDWKTQVEREKEQLKEPAETVETEATRATSGESLPPASFLSLISSLTTQALICLGQIPDPVENQSVVRVDLARHYIDLLEMLDEKTRGNLTDDENGQLQEILHHLRMLYMMVQPPGK